MSFWNLFSGGTKSLSKQDHEQWQNNGFLVLPKYFTHEEIDSIETDTARFWKESRTNLSDLTIDIYLGEKEQRVKLHDAPLEALSHPYKLNDLYLVSNVVRNIILKDSLCKILGELLKGTPLVCNTLSFQYGSEQEFHTDSLYMTPLKKLNLAATWIALEDCHQDAGPLQYYPMSHKIKPFLFSHGKMTAISSEMKNYNHYMQQECKNRDLKVERFCAKKGDVFIWHSQLYHGGSQIIDRSRTRKSLVTHYYRGEDKNEDRVKHNKYGEYWLRPHQPANPFRL